MSFPEIGRSRAYQGLCRGIQGFLVGFSASKKFGVSL